MAQQTASSIRTGERREQPATTIGVKRPIPITEEIYQVGGQGLTAAEDAAIYAIVLPGRAALIDTGCGGGTELLLGNLESIGVLPGRARPAASEPALQPRGLSGLPAASAGVGRGHLVRGALRYFPRQEGSLGFHPPVHAVKAPAHLAV